MTTNIDSATVEAVVLSTIIKHKFISVGELAIRSKLPEKAIEEAVADLIRRRTIVQSVAGVPKRYGPFIPKKKKDDIDDDADEFIGNEKSVPEPTPEPEPTFVTVK